MSNFRTLDIRSNVRYPYFWILDRSIATCRSLEICSRLFSNFWTLDIRPNVQCPRFWTLDLRIASCRSLKCSLAIIFECLLSNFWILDIRPNVQSPRFKILDNRVASCRSLKCSLAIISVRPKSNIWILNICIAPADIKSALWRLFSNVQCPIFGQWAFETIFDVPVFWILDIRFASCRSQKLSLAIIFECPMSSLWTFILGPAGAFLRLVLNIQCPIFGHKTFEPMSNVPCSRFWILDIRILSCLLS